MWRKDLNLCSLEKIEMLSSKIKIRFKSKIHVALNEAEWEIKTPRIIISRNTKQNEIYYRAQQ